MKPVNFSRRKCTASERKCCHIAAKPQFEYVTGIRQQEMKRVEGGYRSQEAICSIAVDSFFVEIQGEVTEVIHLRGKCKGIEAIVDS